MLSKDKVAFDIDTSLGFVSNVKDGAGKEKFALVELVAPVIRLIQAESSERMDEPHGEGIRREPKVPGLRHRDN